MASLDGLPIKQARIHPGLLINKPGLQVSDGLLRILVITRNQVGGNQGPHDVTEAHHGMAVGRKVFRIRFAVAADVRTIRILPIGPPIITFRIEVVTAAFAPIACSRCYGFGLFQQITRGFFHDAGAFNFNDIEGLRVELHPAGKDRQAQGGFP